VPEKFVAAVVQAEPVWLDAVATTAKTVDLIAEAAAAGARIITFPELWIPGYPMFLWLGPVAGQAGRVVEYHKASLSNSDPLLTTVRRAAREHRITVVLGYSERVAGTLYIAQLIIDESGEVILHRRKLKPTHVERSLFGEGGGGDLRVVESSLGRLGALSCAEHLQPLSRYAMYAQHEQVHAACWPCFALYKGSAFALSAEANLAATMTYALEGGCFVLAATQVISQAGVDLFATSEEQRALLPTGGGASRIFAPDGEPLTEPLDEHTEGLLYAEIDLDRIPLAKSAFDPAGHYARPDVTQLVLHTAPATPVLVPGSPDGAVAPSTAVSATAVFPVLDEDA
jgi:aliphatic nitrilase